MSIGMTVVGPRFGGRLPFSLLPVRRAARPAPWIAARVRHVLVAAGPSLLGSRGTGDHAAGDR